MLENPDTNSSPSQNDECGNSSSDYLRRALQACATGDNMLGMHLYLAAFEKGIKSTTVPGEDAVNCLKQAWSLACKLKERSLAEYIFEKMESYLTVGEAAVCAEQLQRLALDKLAEFGLSQEDLEDMTEMISQDYLGMDPSHMLKVEHVVLPHAAALKRPIVLTPAEKAQNATKQQSDLGMSEMKKSVDKDSAAVLKDADISEEQPEKKDFSSGEIVSDDTDTDTDADAHAVVVSLERTSYAEIVGYTNAISLMRDFGLGMQDDEQFQDLVTLLNSRHGLERMPAMDAILFRSPAREDANRFMAATLGELGLPAIRMRMDENMQGMPVLCVMAQADNQPKLNASRNTFEGAGVLLLEDLDLWASPIAESSEDMGNFMFASLSRGAREAISLIRSAVENPDVYVLASAAEGSELDAFFYDLLEPLSVVEIDYPTPEERADIWMDIAREHPSLRSIERDELVRYSSGMPRYDVYMAAREAIEDTYKASLVARNYVPVTKNDLFEKLAAYQPLDSEEYQALENAVIDGFKLDLERLDDLLTGKEE